MRTSTLLTATAATAVVGGLLTASPAVAAAADESVRGSVQNRDPERGRPMDTRTLSVHADERDGTTSGQVNFRHVRQQADGPTDVTGLSEFRGTVDCLSVEGDVVRVAGTVISGSTRTGVSLTGRPYAVEVDTAADEFTLPAFGAGLLDDGGECATSGRERVDITSGQLRTSG